MAPRRILSALWEPIVQILGFFTKNTFLVDIDGR